MVIKFTVHSLQFYSIRIYTNQKRYYIQMFPFTLFLFPYTTLALKGIL